MLPGAAGHPEAHVFADHQDAIVDKYHAPQALRTRAVRRFHVMARPAGPTCNLDCTCCFQLSRQTLPGSAESRPGHPDSVVTDWSVDPAEYRSSLCKVWDERLSRDAGKLLVDFWETRVAQRMRLPARVCTCSEVCGRGIALEHDGSVHACDHYVYPAYRLGNLRERSLGDMVFSPTQVRFGCAKPESLPAYCRRCDFLQDCRGECPKNRLLRTPDSEPGLNDLCAGLERFFAHAGPAASRMAGELRGTADAPPRRR